METTGLRSLTSLPTTRRALVAALLIAGIISVSTFNSAEAGFRYSGPQASPTPAMPMPPSSAMMQAAPQAAAAPMGAQSGMVQGFANQVPLPVALRQILPRGTAFRINNDVDTKTLVSWRGGASWQQTLDDMLAGAGLQASYAQNSVIVQRGAMIMGESPAAMPAPVPTPISALSNAPVTLMPIEAGGPQGGFAAPAYSEANAMKPLDVPAVPPAEAYTPPTLMPAPQPYVAPGSLGVANTVPDSNGTIGSTVQNTVGAVPEGTLGEAPQQAIPGTNVGGMPEMQTSALNQLNPGPADAQTSLAGVAAEIWEAHSGQTLHEVLVAWAQRAGVELNWVAEYDYPIQASINFSGSFEEATRTLLGGFVNAAPQPVGRLHRNEQLGQQALVIETRGNQYAE